MRKLLIIDDNLDFLGFLTSALEKYFEVYTATGVKDALRLLEHQKVEAICSDYNMRDGTGLDLLEEMDILQSKGNSWRTNLNRHRENR